MGIVSVKEDMGKTYVPGEEYEDRTKRQLAHETLEAFLRLTRSV
jgi:hypothetical protein